MFSATSSQGLLYGDGDAIHGGRLARALRARERFARLGLSDHAGTGSQRYDGRARQRLPADPLLTCQEVLDSTLIAYRLAEDERVRLPVIVNLDGFYLSFTREPVEIARAGGGAADYVGTFDPENTSVFARVPPRARPCRRAGRRTLLLFPL